MQSLEVARAKTIKGRLTVVLKMTCRSINQLTCVGTLWTCLQTSRVGLHAIVRSVGVFPTTRGHVAAYKLKGCAQLMWL